MSSYPLRAPGFPVANSISINVSSRQYHLLQAEAPSCLDVSFSLRLSHYLHKVIEIAEIRFCSQSASLVADTLTTPDKLLSTPAR
jgi:hypothetical protein